MDKPEQTVKIIRSLEDMKDIDKQVHYWQKRYETQRNNFGSFDIRTRLPRVMLAESLQELIKMILNLIREYGCPIDWLGLILEFMSRIKKKADQILSIVSSYYISQDPFIFSNSILNIKAEFLVVYFEFANYYRKLVSLKSTCYFRSHF